ncbi:MAG: 1,6-anhydro-N-acetylmuramyl-L-alanine amidase AmpD [Chromatiales bacterium]|nr:1,6-anhydro-N-acetylmuramyl-L-alanine amidase AmpD [Chromatiales bacterium]
MRAPARATTRKRATTRPRRLSLEPGNGLVRGARQLPSPNCDDRPGGMAPELIVIHGISLPPGQFGGPHIDHLFTNALDPAGHDYFRDIAGLRVSSHLLIRRTGEVVQYVPLHRRAWHAGRSGYRGRQQCNDFSVGIELEGTDDQPYTGAQYRRLATVIRLLRRGVPSLATAPIVGHSDVAPGRKTDPGPAFDWPRLRALLVPRVGRRPARKP